MAHESLAIARQTKALPQALKFIGAGHVDFLAVDQLGGLREPVPVMPMLTLAAVEGINGFTFLADLDEPASLLVLLRGAVSPVGPEF